MATPRHLLVDPINECDYHLVQEYIDAYLEAAGVHGEPDSSLFRASAQGKGNGLAERGMGRESVWGMVKRRAAKAALPYAINPHSFRTTSITEYMRNGGDVETAARIAGHESTRTTQLYNRVQEDVSLDEIERVRV